MNWDACVTCSHRLDFGGYRRDAIQVLSKVTKSEFFCKGCWCNHCTHLSNCHYQ
ncbi:hypothetical protein LINPERPRIM_LOCUS19484, partial [Linum perenne]